MIVTVGGKKYEIGGIIYGTLPAWKLIKQDGNPMTGERFNKLPDADKRALVAHVQERIKKTPGRLRSRCTDNRSARWVKLDVWQAMVHRIRCRDVEVLKESVRTCRVAGR